MIEFLCIRQPKSLKSHIVLCKKRYRRLEQTSPRLGRKPILADNLIHMTNLFYGLDSMKFRKIAYECAEQLKIPHNFNKESKCAGPDWLEGFSKRNTNISVRKPKSTSINRIEGFNKEEVELFYKNLEELMVKNRYEAHQIFNMDETGVSTVREPEKILAKTGQKRVGTVTSWERGKTVTVVCAMNSASVYVPPRPPAQFRTVQKMDGLMKVYFLNDNHNSHSTLEAYEFCKANYITMFSIPPHSSHHLQPLDITFFGPLKKAYNRERDLYLKSKNLIKIAPYDMAGLFQKAYSKVASMNKALSGFRATGISPINTNIFNENDYYIVNSVATNTVDDTVDAQDSNQPNQNTAIPDYVEEIQSHETFTSENAHNNDEYIRKNVSSASSDLNFLLALISSEPSTSPEVRKRTHKQHSQVITTSPNKTVLEEKKKKRLMKENKAPKGKGKNIREGKKKTINEATKKAKKFLFKDDTSSSDESVNYHNICDDNSSDYVMTIPTCV
ncbi:hypothetical protein ILUMI_06588 [Ignelater luminosus]|uniref:DDE-1 domain-containing protein n=1 Tax=Ignelater luminosus TaxID=2038154 RepID=A0A8K0D542_IGNLU|nr:hypothetical protein ILUMI_06588 [Ignelater luminosus]